MYCSACADRSGCVRPYRGRITAVPICFSCRSPWGVLRVHGRDSERGGASTELGEAPRDGVSPQDETPSTDGCSRLAHLAAIRGRSARAACLSCSGMVYLWACRHHLSGIGSAYRCLNHKDRSRCRQVVVRSALTTDSPHLASLREATPRRFGSTQAPNRRRAAGVDNPWITLPTNVAKS